MSCALERGIKAGLAVLLSTGCSEPPAPGECPSSDEPTLAFTNRNETSALVDGAEVEVFPPPQGGIFTELDVSIDGVSPSDLETLLITVESSGGLGTLASVTYRGSQLPWWCSEDDVLLIDDLPVGFADHLDLPGLDSEPAVLEGTVTTRSGDVTASVDVVLQWVEY